ncbi:MAG: hypothetical protein OXC30_03780 [Alphaproteobacteria bacterium]|nr:hypothetical protein [Alphaproteobacteria bacterium]
MTLGISTIALDNFRSHTALCLSTNATHVAIVGPNGSGKTNILEACSLFSPGKGLRHKNASCMSPHNQPHKNWKISADLAHIPNASLSVSFDGKKMNRSFADSPMTQLELLRTLHVWWHTPTMDHLLTTPSARRHLLDRSASRMIPEHLHALAHYTHYTKERLLTLRNAPQHTALLNTLEESMVTYGTTIIQNRYATIDALSKELRQELLGECSLRITCTNTLEQNWLDNPEKITSFWLDRLQKNRTRDTEMHRTHTSVHLTRVEWHHVKNGILMPFDSCSTGQRKILCLSFLLAAIRYHITQPKNPPIVLLLDETFAHLDAHIAQSLSFIIKDMPIQIWCTSFDHATLDLLTNPLVVDLPKT